MRFVFLLLGLLLATSANAQPTGHVCYGPLAPNTMGCTIGPGPKPTNASGYVGPLDLVPGATAFYALRAGSAAIAAAGTQTLVNIRRASDNVTCDFLVASSGGFSVTTATCNSSTQGGITPSAFAGTDATASCTLATTTATCTGASSTPHVGSTVAGASLTQPCLITAVGTFAGGAGTFTTSLAGTSTSCGTISVGETFTMTYGLFVTEVYDQTGNGNNVTQATGASQPQFLPITSTSLPGISSVGGQNLAKSFTPASTTMSFSLVAMTVTPASGTRFISGGGSGGSQNQLQGTATANTWTLQGSTSGTISATASDGTWHAGNAVLNGAGSVVNIDGTETTGSVGGATTANEIWFAVTGASGATESAEGGTWVATAFTSTQRSNLRANQKSYWRTP